MPINTYEFSKIMREKILDLENKKIKVTNFKDTLQNKDEYTKTNCKGFGRIRIFNKFSLFLNEEGISKPLFRGYKQELPFKSQVFQMAGCNWRCWHCFVDDSILAANENVTQFLSTDELVKLYLYENEKPDIIDLSGGQPDLVPEWTLWFLKSLEKYNLKGKVFIWIDDNLSSSFLSKYLSTEQIKYISEYPKLSRVGSFKGYDPVSFSFNTGAEKTDYENQFHVFKQLLNYKFDMYAYVTFTSLPESEKITREKIQSFIKKLQDIHYNLPLKVIPLKISKFNALQSRHYINQNMDICLEFQHLVYKIWRHEIKKQYPKNLIELAYEEISLFKDFNEIEVI